MSGLSQIATLESRHRTTMSMLLAYAHSLPVLPHVAASLATVDRDDPLLPDMVEDFSSVDPALAVRMLCLGSHLFAEGLGEHLTLPLALSRLGAKTIARGLGGLATSPSIEPTTAVEKELWLHSLQVAIAAKYLAQRRPECGLLGDEAYLLGLIHDIGRFVMLATSRQKFNAVGESEWDSGDKLIRLELEICGFDHATLGALATAEWRFPELVSHVVRFHHAPRRLGGRGFIKRVAAAVEMIAIADRLSFLILKHPDVAIVCGEEQSRILRDSHIVSDDAVTKVTVPELVRIISPVLVKSNDLWERVAGPRLRPSTS